ncbi:hypothetical protein F2P79_017890 [Pimephales promelas]|nr:hypothetical protein F2P79_017890 [Pimephales promelas]
MSENMCSVHPALYPAHTHNDRQPGLSSEEALSQLHPQLSSANITEMQMTNGRKRIMLSYPPVISLTSPLLPPHWIVEGPTHMVCSNHSSSE